jgi:hypothetical protein
MLDIFQRSNVYRALAAIYLELGAFGTAAALVADDFDNVIHIHPFTVGEYAIATNAKGEVDTFYREFQRTVCQLVDEFGVDNVSKPPRGAHTSRARAGHVGHGAARGGAALRPRPGDAGCEEHAVSLDLLRAGR